MSHHKEKLSVLKLLILGLVWGVVFLFFVILFFAYDIKTIDEVEQSTRKPTIVLFDKDNQYLMTLGEMGGSYVKLNEMPKALINAVLALEDRRFLQHRGIDFIGILRACYHNYLAKGKKEGGSTITQQLAKNIFLSNEKSIRRKVQEALLALWLESKFTKKQILELYLNRVYLGRGTYGVDAACRRFFHKSARDINLYEAVIIAGLLKAPSKYSPISSPDSCFKRAQLALDAMYDAKYIKRHYAMVPIKNLIAENQNSHLNYFADYVLDELDKRLERIDQDILVYTTLDKNLQQQAYEVVQKKLPKDGTQVGIVSMNSYGQIRLIIGGNNYSKSPFNRAFQSKRQMGSVFKLVIYLAALENGYLATSLVADTPLKIGKWIPKNHKWESRGEITLLEAFAASVNTSAIRIARSLGYRKIIEMAERLGLYSYYPRDLTISLGTADSSLLNIASAYNAVANDGIYSKPYSIRAVLTKNGRKIYGRAKELGREVVSVDVAHKMKEMLRAVMKIGTGKKIGLYNVYGKTGTTQGNVDAWFIGSSYKGKEMLTLGIWTGHDDNKPNNYGGSGIPLEIFGSIMN